MKIESHSKKAARLRRQAQKKRAKGKKVVLKQPKLKHARVPFALMSEVAETRDEDEKTTDFFAHMEAASEYLLRIDKKAIGMAEALKDIALFMAASGCRRGVGSLVLSSLWQLVRQARRNLLSCRLSL